MIGGSALKDIDIQVYFQDKNGILMNLSYLRDLRVPLKLCSKIKYKHKKKF